jgi:hypothetical protein
VTCGRSISRTPDDVGSAPLLGQSARCMVFADQHRHFLHGPCGIETDGYAPRCHRCRTGRPFTSNILPNQCVVARLLAGPSHRRRRCATASRTSKCGAATSRRHLLRRARSRRATPHAPRHGLRLFESSTGHTRDAVALRQPVGHPNRGVVDEGVDAARTLVRPHRTASCQRPRECEPALPLSPTSSVTRFLGSVHHAWASERATPAHRARREPRSPDRRTRDDRAAR